MCFFVSILDFVYFITELMFTIFPVLFPYLTLSTLLTLTDAFHTIYETCTELVHSSESLWQKVRTQNPKVYELIPRKESKFSLSLYLFFFPIADSFFNVLLNRSSWLLENTCVTPTVRGTKIYTNILQSVRNVVGNLNAYLRNALHQKKKNPKMNTQSASINAKIFGTL